MYQKIENEVKAILNMASAHGFDHVDRVLKMALKLAKEENANQEIVTLASLLHDVDDYKFVGVENSKSLSNARKIMDKAGVSIEKQEHVCDIILSMGYSNTLKGIRPKTIEGQVVSDADMLDAMGVTGVVRALEYALSNGGIVFDENIFPEEIISYHGYQKKAIVQEPALNHLFDKLLKLNGLMITKTAKKEAKSRHDLMILFLKEFFKEQNQEKWLTYLENYLKKL